MTTGGKVVGLVSLVGFVGIVLPVDVFRVVVRLVGFDVVPFDGVVLSVAFRVVVGFDVVPFVGFDVDVFKVLVENEVSVVGPQLQAVVGFRVVIV